MPTRNEPNIHLLIKRLFQYADEVIVCDESEDTGRTEWYAHQGGASVLQCHGGIGPSCMAGWTLALEHGHSRIIQIDAGGSHLPADITELTLTAADITIGSRFLPGGSYTGRQWRAQASRAYAFSMDRRSGEHLTDWTSGFRCFTDEAAKTLLGFSYQAAMHGWQAEVLLRAFDAGMTITEVPIHYQAARSALRARHVLEAVRVR